MTQQHKNLDLALDQCSMTMIDKIIDGKLVEHYGDLDSAGLMQQLMPQGVA